jgi:MFS family permease
LPNGILASISHNLHLTHERQIMHKLIPSKSAPFRVIVVAALGYFVDLYDLVLFSVLRVESLKALGVPSSDLLNTGVLLLNLQMAGMLIGGVAFGMLGDRRGRMSVLYASILLYSAANLGNAAVTSTWAYGILRFVSGVGLAGELGAGVTLVMELMDRRTRGWGTTIIATVGVLGAATAAIVGDFLPWRAAYLVGGGLGLTVLLLRVRNSDSLMFSKVQSMGVAKGDLRLLFSPASRLLRYVAVILIGLPIWYTASILITFCPEFAKSFGMSEIPTAGQAVFYYYLGLSFGDLASGAMSQLVRSRRVVVALFVSITALTVAAYFLSAPVSLAAFYRICFVLGLANGYWAVFMAIASEQFGTNLRSTVTTSIPNFVRGAVIPITYAFQSLSPSLGLTGSALAVGATVTVASLVAITITSETFARDLDFVEI